MQLLSIHSIPIQYQMHVEPAHLEMEHAADAPTAKVTQQDSKLVQHTTNSQIHMNAYNMRKAFGLLNSTDFAHSRAEKAEAHISSVIQDTVITGKQLSHIEKNVTISDIIKQKALKQPSYKTVFLPNGGTEISWTPGKTDLQYEPGHVSMDWNLPQVDCKYVPSSFSLKITQWPHVEVKYIGGFNYFPPSADPESTGKAE
ncbi:MAG TPA: hypothetical protein DEP60_01875 [Ruminococcaceae bacterium]|nr:hypothetical protein [Oscillospiraceae bacterium]